MGRAFTALVAAFCSGALASGPVIPGWTEWDLRALENGCELSSIYLTDSGFVPRKGVLSDTPFETVTITFAVFRSDDGSTAKRRDAGSIRTVLRLAGPVPPLPGFDAAELSVSDWVSESVTLRFGGDSAVALLPSTTTQQLTETLSEGAAPELVVDFENGRRLEIPVWPRGSLQFKTWIRMLHTCGDADAT